MRLFDKGGLALKKIYVLIGNFGSGKTELALNFALKAAETGKTLLIDLDMVNTYFRLTERKAMIAKAGIHLISPLFVSTNVETLSLPAEVTSAFYMDWDTVVFDVGGDPAGATALGRFHSEFMELAPGQLEVLDVVNVRRPMSGTVDKILHLMEDMQRNARIPVTGFVNNTNLAEQTTEEELRDGFRILKEAVQKSGVPVAYTAGKREALQAFLAEKHDRSYIGTPIEVETYMHRDWATFEQFGL